MQSSQRNTLHPCAHELHMSCTTGELAFRDELCTSRSCGVVDKPLAL